MAPRPLLLTRDPDLLDDVLRVAATAGVEVQVAADVGAARPLWLAAACVLVAPDLAGACARARLPRRPGVVLVGSGPDDPRVWQRAVEVGAEHVVFLPDADAWLAEKLAESVETLDRAGRVVAVVGGRGGAGATTLAVGLAVTAIRLERSALLLDADPLGGGVELAFGGEEASGLRWPDLASAHGRLPGPALLAALPQLAGLPVLSWDRSSATSVPGSAMAAVMGAGRRASDVVVVDLPRAPDEAARAALELADCVLLVVPAQVRAVAAAAQVAARVGALCGDLRVVVRGPFASRLAPDAVAAALGLPLAGYLESEPRLDAALDRGEPPGMRGRGPLAVLCQELLSGPLPAVAPRAA